MADSHRYFQLFENPLRISELRHSLQCSADPDKLCDIKLSVCMAWYGFLKDQKIFFKAASFADICVYSLVEKHLF